METQMLLYLKQAQAAMHNAHTPYSHFAWAPVWFVRTALYIPDAI